MPVTGAGWRLEAMPAKTLLAARTVLVWMATVSSSFSAYPPAKVDHEGHAPVAGEAQDHLIALLKALDGEGQSAELIVAIGIGAGDVGDQLGLEARRGPRSGLSQPRYRYSRSVMPSGRLMSIDEGGFHTG